MTEYHAERILTEVEKVVMTVSGVYLDEAALLESTTSQSAVHKGVCPCLVIMFMFVYPVLFLIPLRAIPVI